MEVKMEERIIARRGPRDWQSERQLNRVGIRSGQSLGCFVCNWCGFVMAPNNPFGSGWWKCPKGCNWEDW